METPLLELLRCPFCRSPLAGADGALACARCGRGFGIEDGIPLMLHEDLPGAALDEGIRSADNPGQETSTYPYAGVSVHAPRRGR